MYVSYEFIWNFQAVHIHETLIIGLVQSLHFTECSVMICINVMCKNTELKVDVSAKII